MMNRNFAAERRLSLDRRQFMRGLGACIALPALESAHAAGAAITVPTRMAFLYVPNGTIPSAWWPAGDGGSDFALPPTLEPLAGVRHRLQVISGLQDLDVYKRQNRFDPTRLETRSSPTSIFCCTFATQGAA